MKLNESVEQMNRNSFIKRVENRLRNDGFTLALIDYGIMGLDSATTMNRAKKTIKVDFFLQPLHF